ncbi:unnamed protein product [Wuchereria bancrofti]|uniref:Cyclic nucleotide-binding domain-containing protein n=1 Tax=Wuchereria bancrofti TaxID=6293 RepID=A0A3P7ERT9_WUCBA|nr:unnamed protein product [Wuchereria bancrofti]
MDRLVARIQRQSRSKQFPNALLFTILGNSDCKPKQIANGVLRNNFYYYFFRFNSNNFEIRKLFTLLDISTQLFSFSEYNHFMASLIAKGSAMILLFKTLLFHFAVFQSGDQIFYWYLLLSGEVQLFLSTAEIKCAKEIKDRDAERSRHDAVSFQNECIIETLQPIALFGELSISRHSCSARVIRPAEIVTINQSHFVAVYNVCVIYFVINFNNN